MPYNTARYSADRDPRWPILLIIAGCILTVLLCAGLVALVLWWWVGLAD